MVAILQSGTSKDDRVTRSLFFFLASYNVVVGGRHIPGVENGAADALSWNNAAAFLSQVPAARREPTVIPAELLRLLVHEQPDWTSQSWTSSFASFLRRVYRTRPRKHIVVARDAIFSFCKDANVQAVPAS